jgi:hypothetical protein
MTHLMLIPSPFLGSAVWEPVASLLRRDGCSVNVATFPTAPRRPGDVIDALLSQFPEATPVLVPHSNAGLYVAAVAAQLPLAGIVFVDALIPAPDESTPVAADDFARAMGALADSDGLLPPWTRWWPEEATSGLFPDPRTRTVVEAQQHRLPADYLEQSVPSPPGWDQTRASYLGFGDTYAEEQSAAAARGWPVRNLPGRHLHMLIDPPAVATAIRSLAEPSDVHSRRSTGV